MIIESEMLQNIVTGYLELALGLLYTKLLSIYHYAPPQTVKMMKMRPEELLWVNEESLYQAAQRLVAFKADKVEAGFALPVH